MHVYELTLILSHLYYNLLTYFINIINVYNMTDGRSSQYVYVIVTLKLLLISAHILVCILLHTQRPQ